MGLTGTPSVADAERQLQDAIDLGQLTAQHAPDGDPIFAALERAQADLSSIQDDEAVILPALVPGTRTYQEISDAIDGITAAAANVRNAPDQPLQPTTFPVAVQSIPWVPLGLGLAALGLGWYLFGKKERRA